MTMNQQTRDALSKNWQGAKEKIRAEFPDVTDEDFAQGEGNPDGFVSAIASRTGQDQASVEQRLSQVAQNLK